MPFKESPEHLVKQPPGIERFQVEGGLAPRLKSQNALRVELEWALAIQTQFACAEDVPFPKLLIKHFEKLGIRDLPVKLRESLPCPRALDVDSIQCSPAQIRLILRPRNRLLDVGQRQ